MKNRLQQAAEFYEIEKKFMAEHGWTEKAYIARYGTTEKPLMGDGGPLIWEADLNALFRARDYFLTVLQKTWHRGNFDRWEKISPLAAKIWKEHCLGLPKELDDIHSRRASARMLVDSMERSFT